MEAHHVLQGQRLLLWCDDSALDQEFILAFRIHGRLLLHRLQHHCTSTGDTYIFSDMIMRKGGDRRTLHLDRLVRFDFARVRPYAVQLRNRPSLSHTSNIVLQRIRTLGAVVFTLNATG